MNVCFRGENVTKGILVAVAMIVAAPSLPHAQQITPEAQKRRNQIHLMEGLLARAGSLAAEAFGHRLREIEPNMSVFIGQSRARGFVLDGYGIFFDVEVPELRTTIVLAQAMMQRDLEIANALSLLKRALTSLPEGPSRQQAEHAIKVLDLQAGPVQPPQTNAQAFGPASGDPAIKVNEGTAPAPEPAPAPPLPPSQEAAAAQASFDAIMKDPRKEYRDTVQRELIDVMLDYSLPMDVAPDEWLAVAARVTEAGQRGQILMLRVKGSDLAIFAADKSRRDEIRSKVEVSVF